MSDVILLTCEREFSHEKEGVCVTNSEENLTSRWKEMNRRLKTSESLYLAYKEGGEE
jgi:hypothetical protein